MSSITKRLKNLADPGRLRILALVAEAGELCVCEVERLLGVTVSTASRNLRELEAGGWLASRREGRWIHYSLSEVDATWMGIRKGILDAYRNSPDAMNDFQRLREQLAEVRGSLCTGRPAATETNPQGGL